jgi:putative ABC transport system permease protein
MQLALNNLLQDKLRFALSIIGIALAVMLILFLLGLRQGVFKSSTIYLDKTPGTIAVLPAGVNSSHGHGQFLPPETVREISRTTGVARAIPVQLQLAALELHGRKEIVQLVGYDKGLGGGPWSLAEGREPQADNEIVLDKTLAGRHGFGVGDSIDIKGQPLLVAGLSNETSSFTGAYVFAPRALVEKLTLAGGATYVIVTPTGGTSQRDLIASLGAVQNTTVVPKSQVMAKDQKLLAAILDQIVYLMVAAAFIVGALVVGMVIYTAVLERRSEYGILKAIGARSGVLYRVVAWQALIAAGLGSLLGIALAFALGTLVQDLKPQFLVSIEPASILITLATGLVMALAGAMFPARAVTSLAPAEVFRR